MGRPWAPAGGHMENCGLTAQAHTGICASVRLEPGLWTPHPLPWAQRWETPNAGGREGPRSSPNFRPPLYQLRGRKRGGLGMSPPEAGKAEARQKQEASGLGGGGAHSRSQAGPSSPLTRTQSPSLPQGLGPWPPLPPRQPEVVNCPHCTEGTSEAREERSLRGSGRQRRLSILDPPCIPL